eukprot:630271-Pleurochrysis_carterae.AAC.2
MLLRLLLRPHTASSQGVSMLAQTQAFACYKGAHMRLHDTFSSPDLSVPTFSTPRRADCQAEAARQAPSVARRRTSVRAGVPLGRGRLFPRPRRVLHPAKRHGLQGHHLAHRQWCRVPDVVGAGAAGERRRLASPALLRCRCLAATLPFALPMHRRLSTVVLPPRFRFGSGAKHRAIARGASHLVSRMLFSLAAHVTTTGLLAGSVPNAHFFAVFFSSPLYSFFDHCPMSFPVQTGLQGLCTFCTSVLILPRLSTCDLPHNFPPFS